MSLQSSQPALSSDTLPLYTLQYPYPPSDASATPPPDTPLQLSSSNQLPFISTEYPYLSQAQYYSPSPTDSAFADSNYLGTPDYPPPPYSLVAGAPVLTSGAALAADSAPPHTPNADMHYPPLSSRPRSKSSSSKSSLSSSSSSSSSSHASPASARISTMVHPYARLYTKKEGGTKRRKMWNHALEKALFTPQEISTMGAPHRRTIYTSSLEAHVDRLHAQLLDFDLFPVPFEALNSLRGLNSKTTKSMVSGLYHDASELRLKRLELERSITAMRSMLLSLPAPHMHTLREGEGLSLPLSGRRREPPRV